jgi:hypothetical protein
MQDSNNGIAPFPITSEPLNVFGDVAFKGFHYSSAVVQAKRIKSIVMCISSCMTNKEITVGYFTARTKEQSVADFKEVFECMHIDDDQYFIDKVRITFATGSSIVFLDAVANS